MLLQQCAEHLHPQATFVLVNKGSCALCVSRPNSWQYPELYAARSTHILEAVTSQALWIGSAL